MLKACARRWERGSLLLDASINESIDLVVYVLRAVEEVGDSGLRC